MTVLAVHPVGVASTRLRAAQYAPILASAGVQMRLWSFFRPQDLAAWFGPHHHGRVRVLLVAMLRLPLVIGALRRADIVLVQREALPLGPPWLELLAARRRRLVWDVDDAVWEEFESPTAGRVPGWVRATARKYERLCKRADAVWAGSEVLASWCRELNPSVIVVPTAVDVPDRAPTRAAGHTVGWIGSHSTAPFLEAVLPAMTRVSPPPRVVVVGARVMAPAELTVSVFDWSEANESSALAAIRVGLYPVDRAHPLAEGKCGLKAVLYMAHGIPPVLTPTTTNAAVVRDGVEGLYADSEAEWTAAVQRLLDDDRLWERLSRAAYERARSDFSTQIWGPRLAHSLLTLGGR